MIIDLKQFSLLQKNSKASFFAQQKLVKQVISGKTVLCTKCKKPLKLLTPAQTEPTGIRCQKGCTDISLDFT
jgi:hypothetical protein